MLWKGEQRSSIFLPHGKYVQCGIEEFSCKAQGNFTSGDGGELAKGSRDFRRDGDTVTEFQ